MALLLVVEDDPEINSLMALTLRVEDYDVIQARDGEQALQMVQDRAPDLILLDVMMPRMSGYDVARTLQDKPSTAHIPIIFVTAKSEMEDRVLGLEMAVDYVCKPFAAPELLARVRAALRMRKLQDELRVSNEQLSHLATTDALTGLYNRRHFDAQLENEMRRAQRFGNSLAVVVFDLDRFKTVNDTWGHAQGDAVLQAFADVLRGQSRRIDTVARLGGEEFGAILPATEESGACAFAEKVRVTTEEMAVPRRTREGASESPIRITTSGRRCCDCGAFRCRTHARAVRPGRRAGRRSPVIQAKTSGRNRVVAQTLLETQVAGQTPAPHPQHPTPKVKDARFDGSQHDS